MNIEEYNDSVRHFLADENNRLRAALKCFNDLLKENGWHTGNVLKRHGIDPKILETL